MKKLLKSKQGSTLVEIVIAVALLTIMSSGIITALVTSHKTTMVAHESKPKYEDVVGKMDEMLSTDTSAVTGDSTNVNVQFPTGTSASVGAKVIKDTDLQNIAIVKAD